MTATSRPSSPADESRTDEGPAPDGTDIQGGWRARRPSWPAIATVAGILALVCAALLPLLPVSVSQPEVSWPLDPADPRPTALQLTTQRPLALDVQAGCDAMRAAASAGTGRALGEPGDGLLLATLPPVSPAAEVGLLATVRDDRLSVVSRGIPLVEGPLPPGPCAVAITGDLDRHDGHARRPHRRPGGTRGRPRRRRPRHLRAAPRRAAPGCGIRLTVDDQFSTSPTFLKTLVTALLLVAVGVVLAALRERDRAVRAARWEPAVDDVDGVVARTPDAAGRAAPRGPPRMAGATPAGGRRGGAGPAGAVDLHRPDERRRRLLRRHGRERAVHRLRRELLPALQPGIHPVHVDLLRALVVAGRRRR